VQGLGDVVDAGSIGGVHHGVDVHVAHAADFFAHGVRHFTVRADNDRFGLDADGPQGGDGVLGGFGLQFLGRSDVRNQGDVQEEDVGPADVLADLAGRFEERLGFDIAHSAADFGDDDVGGVLAFGGQAHAALDLIGDVRDDLHGVAQVFAAAFLGDDGGVHLAGGHVGRTLEVFVEEALVVSDVQVSLGTVVRDEDFAVLEGVHRARIHVQVGIELLHSYRQAACPQQMTEA
jgi:hypothetical protein